MIFNRAYSSVFIEEGGWTRYKQISRVNSANLANNHSKKLGTLTDSARADRLASGPDRPHGHFGAQHMPPCLFLELSEPKATNTM